MDTFPLVVLANEPGSYRSLLAAELPFLRPNLRVLEVNPAELDAAVATYHPSVVICSRALEKGADAEFSVLVLCSEEIETFIQSSDGTLVNPRLSDILGAIDRALPSEPHVSKQKPPPEGRMIPQTPAVPGSPFQAETGQIRSRARSFGRGTKPDTR